MSKKIYIIHGWDGGPHEKQLIWLKGQLIANSFEVGFPVMPNAKVPEIGAWVSHLQNTINDLGEDVYLVGHSIGCQAIMRYLESLPENVKIGGVIFIAGWFTLTGLETKEEEDVAKPWLTVPIDFNKVKSHTDKFVAIFSDDDPFVPLENQQAFEKNLGAKTLLFHECGHFTSETLLEMPEVLTEILKITQNA